VREGKRSDGTRAGGRTVKAAAMVRSACQTRCSRLQTFSPRQAKCLKVTNVRQPNRPTYVRVTATVARVVVANGQLVHNRAIQHMQRVPQRGVYVCVHVVTKAGEPRYNHVDGRRHPNRVARSARWRKPVRTCCWRVGTFRHRKAVVTDQGIANMESQW